MADQATIAAFRFGYGLPLPDADVAPETMLARLKGPDEALSNWPSATLDEALAFDLAYRNAKKEGRALNEKDAARREVKAVTLESDKLAIKAAKATLIRAVTSPDGMRERLVQFWADHFTTTARQRVQRALPAVMVDEAIRPNLMRPFREMLRAVVTHPAMLLYLDQVNSIGPESKRGQRRKKGLNENLARELLELHTLGVSAGYDQADVREMAELLTGLVVEPGTGFAFEPNRAEPGPETVFGISYSGEGTKPIFDALDDLALRPETARHLASKLAVHFVSDAPDEGLVGALEEAWLASGGDLAAVVEALLRHEAAWFPEASKARQPFDFLVASLRALGVDADRISGMPDKEFLRLVIRPMADMGQPWQSAPGPDGWPEAAEDWITPQGLAARITWAMEAPARLTKPLPDPRDFVTRALGARGSERLVWAVSAAESVPEGVGLVLASPEFNRR
jgi:uncharacterized protein (DUF1800 family)